MKTARRFLQRVAALLRPGRAESDLSREITAHLQLLEDQFVAQGMNRADARYAARRTFGGVEQAKELHRDARTFRWLAGWPMDLKLGVRMLRKSPGLTVVGVIALAVAIGAGAGYLEFVNDFFRPKLSFPGGDRLVGLLNWDIKKGDIEARSLYEFAAWKPQLTTIEELGASHAIDRSLVTDDGRVDPAQGVEISASAFRLVPTPPLAGRPLVDADERPGAPPVLVLGEDLWRARFNADPSVVGRSVTLGDAVYTVVGIMPSSFGFPNNARVWLPLHVDASRLTPGESARITIFGRLTRGTTLEQAQAEVSRLVVQPGHRAIVKTYVESLWTNANMLWQVRLFYGCNVLFLGLLALSAANVATLVFARTATRESEITVRTALGASRGRIVAQLVAEAMVLTTLAAGTGLAGAGGLLRWIREVWTIAQAEPLPFWWNEQLGGETLLYTLALVAIASLLIGGMPALKATGPRMQQRLREAGASGGSMRFGKWWTGIIVTQVAVTMTFLLTVVALGWDLYATNQKDTDFIVPASEYVVARVSLEEDAPEERERRVLGELIDRLERDPGIIGVTSARQVPGGEHGMLTVEFADAAITSRARDAIHVSSAIVGTQYFETLQQRIVAGRPFSSSEVQSRQPVAIVDETFARTVLGGRNPIGLRVRQRTDESNVPAAPWYEIVGVVQDVSRSPVKTIADATIYRPGPPAGGFSTYVITHARSTDGSARIRAAAAGTDPELQLADVVPMDQLAEAETETLRFFTRALALVAAVGLLLSTAGIYALISFTLSRRTREIGIRTALGAAPSRIVTAILSRACIQVGIGLVLGAVPGALLLVFGSDATTARGLAAGVATTVAVGAFVIAIALAACVRPVRRALGIQPTDALRAGG